MLARKVGFGQKQSDSDWAKLMKYETPHWCTFNILARLFGLMALLAASAFFYSAFVLSTGAAVSTSNIDAAGYLVAAIFCLALGIAFLKVAPYRPDLRVGKMHSTNAKSKASWWTGTPKKDKVFVGPLRVRGSGQGWAASGQKRTSDSTSTMEHSMAIQLPFTRESAVLVLRCGAHPDTYHYSHKEIAEWCDRFWCQYLDVDAPPEIEELLPVLTDVETQWDLYLANTFSIEELRSGAFDTERMPVEWFRDWLRQINEQP